MRMISIALFLFVGIYSKSSFSWEPCLPFCDVNCSGLAMAKLAGDSVSTLSSYQAECAQLTKTLSDSSRGFSELAVDFAEASFLKHSNAVTSLDAMTNKLMLSITGRAKVHGEASNLFTANIVSSLKELSKIRSFLTTEEAFGELGQYSHPYLSKSSCERCTEEPVYLLAEISDGIALTSSELAVIAFESGGEAQNSGLKEVNQNEWVNSKLNADLTRKEQVRMHSFLFNRQDSLSPRKEAVRKLKAVLHATTMATIGSLDSPELTDLNLDTAIGEVSYDSALRGHSSNAIAMDMTSIMMQREHGLLLRRVIAQNATNVNLHELQNIARKQNIYLAIKMLELDKKE